MNREYHKLFSTILQQDIELLRFGDWGQPIITFPTSKGMFYDFENFGMIDVLAPLIKAKKIQVFCVQTIDKETLYNEALKLPYTISKYKELCDQISLKQSKYYSFIGEELFSWIKNIIGATELPILLGCSFGALHAVNIAFRYPVQEVIGLGGAYRLLGTNFMHFNPIYYVNNSNYFPELISKINTKFTLGCGKNDFVYLGHHKPFAEVLEGKYVIKNYENDGDHSWETWKTFLRERFEVLCI